jgi:predicted transcriptional regulator
MYLGITNIERFVLESLIKSSKDILQLSKDLSLDLKVCHNSLNQLCAKGLVQIEGNIYSLDKKNGKKHLSYINSPDSLSNEFSSLIETHIENSISNKKDNFSLKKVFLNNEDQLLFKAMLKSLESFLNEVNSKNKKQKYTTKDKSYIFWGFNQYDEIINNI